MMFFLPPFRRSPCVCFLIFFFLSCTVLATASFSKHAVSYKRLNIQPGSVWYGFGPCTCFSFLLLLYILYFFSHCNFTFIYLFPPPPLPLLLVLVLVLPPPPSPSPFIHPAKLTNQGVTANESCSWPGFLSVLQEIRVLD